jgi:ribosomal protein S18 acetylase RimI-like enzyme
LTFFKKKSALNLLSSLRTAFAAQIDVTSAPLSLGIDLRSLELSAPGQVRITEASAADAAVIVDILQASFGEYAGKLDPPSQALNATVENIPGTLSRSTCYLAYFGSEAAGCVFGQPEEDGSLYLFRLGVRPEYRHLGIGRKLIEAVEHQASRQGFRRVTLATRLVMEVNLAYYRRLGYTHYKNGVDANGREFCAYFEKVTPPIPQ